MKGCWGVCRKHNSAAVAFMFHTKLPNMVMIRSPCPHSSRGSSLLDVLQVCGGMGVMHNLWGAVYKPDRTIWALNRVSRKSWVIEIGNYVQCQNKWELVWKLFLIFWLLWWKGQRKEQKNIVIPVYKSNIYPHVWYSLSTS